MTVTRYLCSEMIFCASMNSSETRSPFRGTEGIEVDVIRQLSISEDGDIQGMESAWRCDGLIGADQGIEQPINDQEVRVIGISERPVFVYFSPEYEVTGRLVGRY